MDAPLLLLEPDPALEHAAELSLRLPLRPVLHVPAGDRGTAERIYRWVLGLERPWRGRVVVDGVELLDLRPRELREWRLHSAAGVRPPFPLGREAGGDRPSLGEGLRTALRLGGDSNASIRARAAQLEDEWRRALRGVSEAVESRVVPIAWATARQPVILVLLGVREGLARRDDAAFRRALAPLRRRRCAIVFLEVRPVGNRE